ncbi:MAG: putative toxin-antitoxin system toxin component, PIN family [Burkholderiales bacterium]|jgi:putative PIN family toxin of toxin-antitoxin system|nr:putative toxin-antitoxin system toxin component, PIN family [Burkholderiales bacterium]
MAGVPSRVVLDTNVLISAALLPSSVPARLLHHLLVHSRLVFSAATFAELETRLWKPKFDRYITLAARRSLLAELSAVAEWVKPRSTTRHSRDPDDDAFIHAAIEGRASWLVSGDDDLLVLVQVGDVEIMRPGQALARCVG